MDSGTRHEQPICSNWTSVSVRHRMHGMLVRCFVAVSEQICNSRLFELALTEADETHELRAF